MLDIHVMVNWHQSKQGIRWPVSHNHIMGSSLELIEFTCLIIYIYCLALSHKDWELPNLQIWLAEMDTDHGLDFPI